MKSSSIQDSVRGSISVVAIVATLLFLNSAVYAQGPDFTRAKRAGGIEADKGYEIATEGSGSSPITRCFSDSATFGTTTLTSADDSDILISKLEESAVQVTIPDTTGAPWQLVSIPIIVSDVTGLGIIAFDIILSWNPSVLKLLVVEPGVVVPEYWTIVKNIQSDSVRIGGAGASLLSGSGSLVVLTFQVVGQHCNTTPIHFNEMIFNEGIPSAITHDGHFHVLAEWDIQGYTKYYSNGAPIDDVIVQANYIYKDTTDPSGYYGLLDLPLDNYVIRPVKQNDVASAINAFDAANILQYGVGLQTFTPYQMLASDVTDNGSVSAYDASMILQYGVGLINKFPVMEDTTHFWRFVPQDFPITQTNWNIAPDSIAYTPLNSDTTDNYYGIIYGDVSGNWYSSCSALASLMKSSAGTVEIRLEDINGEAGEKVALPVILENSSDILAISFTLEYDARVLKALNAATTELTENWQIAHNIKEGQIKVALAGSKPIATPGAMVNLEFEVLGTEQGETSSPLNISEITINEGNIAVNIQSAKFTTGTPLPKEYALSQNYPNPFNAQTVIKYQIPKPGRVVLKIYNSLGQEVRTLVDEEKKAGYYRIYWDGKNNDGQRLTSGVYLYRIRTREFVQTRKVVLLK